MQHSSPEQHETSSHDYFSKLHFNIILLSTFGSPVEFFLKLTGQSVTAFLVSLVRAVFPFNLTLHISFYPPHNVLCKYKNYKVSNCVIFHVLLLLNFIWLQISSSPLDINQPLNTLPCKIRPAVSSPFFWNSRLCMSLWLLGFGLRRTASHSDTLTARHSVRVLQSALLSFPFLLTATRSFCPRLYFTATSILMLLACTEARTRTVHDATAVAGGSVENNPHLLGAF
jgi:hypothetical protein